MSEVLSVQEALKETESVFVGHPADTLSPDKPVEDPELTLESEPEIEQEPEIEPEIEPEAKPDFKYKSHEEAEKGAIEALKLRERDIEQIKDLRSKLTVLEEKDAERVKKEADNFSIDKEIADEFAESLRGLDEDEFEGDPYERQAQIQMGIMEKIVRRREVAANTEKKAAEDKRQQDDDIVGLATKTASDAGLNMDKDSVEYNLFWDISLRAQGNTVEERIEDTITKVNDIKAALIKTDDDRKKKVKTTQENNQVLGKGVWKPAEKSKLKTPLSVSDAFEQIGAERRI